MRELKDVYESARLCIPARLFPARSMIPPWSELDDSVHRELAELNDNVLSVPQQETRLLLSYQRVINEFNKGVRKGYLETAGIPEGEDPDLYGKAPFRAGLVVGRRASKTVTQDMGLAKQFITATHLFDYEFGQLHQALQSPFEFLLSNLSPDRSDELGDLAIVLPMLINHQRGILKQVIADPGFSFSGYYLNIGPAPSHLEYLSAGCVALFDPDPLSWQRVAAYFGLASRAFGDGSTLQIVDHLAPEHAVLTVLGKPIAACRAVRQQMDRIELARKWVAVLSPSFSMDEPEDGPATLWDIYLMTPCSQIRGGDEQFGDLVTSTVARAASDHLEAVIPNDQERLAFFRKHFVSFLRGFDARHEGVVTAAALSSVTLGRALSDGFRRFETGGPLIGAVSQGLAELAQTLNEVHHANVNPTAYVLDKLHATDETEVADCLVDLFTAYPALLSDLFGGTGRFEFFSRTQIQVFSPYDLLRGALFHALRNVGHDVMTDDERRSMRDSAEEQLGMLRDFVNASPSSKIPAMEPGAAQRILNQNKKVLDAGCVLADNFEVLLRLLGQLWSPLYMARVLTSPQSKFQQ